MNLGINGKLNFGIRNINESDLKDLENFVKFSKSKNWCGKACIAIRFLFTGKGIISTQNVNQLIEKSPSKKEIYEKYPFFKTLLKANEVALNHFPEQPIQQPANPQQKNLVQKEIPLDLHNPFYNVACLSLDDFDKNPTEEGANSVRARLCEYFTTTEENISTVIDNLILVNKNKSELTQKLVLEETVKAWNYHQRKKEKEARIQKMYPNGINENPGKLLEVDYSKLNANLDEIRVGMDEKGDYFQCTIRHVIELIIKDINAGLEFKTNFYKDKGKNMAYTIEEFRNVNIKDMDKFTFYPYEKDLPFIAYSKGLPVNHNPRDHVIYSKHLPYNNNAQKNLLDKVLEILLEANYIMDFEFSPHNTKALTVQV